jgi:hypothetical protein
MSYSRYRRSVNRCTARLLEMRHNSTRRDSWRCQLEVGHKGDHITYSGHRSWVDPTNGDHWNRKVAPPAPPPDPPGLFDGEVES